MCFMIPSGRSGVLQPVMAAPSVHLAVCHSHMVPQDMLTHTTAPEHTTGLHQEGVEALTAPPVGGGCRGYSLTAPPVGGGCRGWGWAINRISISISFLASNDHKTNII